MGAALAPAASAIGAGVGAGATWGGVKWRIASLRARESELLALVAERTRISRDIHDTVAQSLSSIRLLAHAQVDRSPDPAAITGAAA